MRKNLYLSDFSIKEKSFKDLKKVLKIFKSKNFLKLNLFQKEKKVNEELLALLKKQEIPCFLFPKVLNYIEKINLEKILQEYHFSSFEIWLNKYSGLSFEENYQIRAKIAGKYIPREQYQKMFPIGMGKIYEGSHIVTAHCCPDLDTTVGSFWGWVDAFAARVSENLHIWNVPEGVPNSQEVELFFKGIFSESLFTRLLKTSSNLNLTSRDILNVENIIYKKKEDSTSFIDHKRFHNAVVVVDDKGYYLGDWRSFDVEDIKSINSILEECFGWFKNKIYFDLISLFSKKDIYLKDLEIFQKKIFQIKLEQCSLLKNYTEDQKNKLNEYLKKVFFVDKGKKATFQEFSKALFKSSIKKFSKLSSFFEKKRILYLFDKKRKLKEDRIAIFNYFEKIMKNMQEALQEIQIYVERMDVALKIKKDVFKYLPTFVFAGDEIGEIKSKMSHNIFLSILRQEKKNFIPIGVVKSRDLKKKILGTVSFRDFGSKDEVKMASYLEVISIIDHHKTNLNTENPACIITSDAQATSSILAKLSFEINDKYSVYDMSKQDIENQIKLAKKDSLSILKKLLQKKEIKRKKDKFFVSKEREFLEYLHFLYAILDDTDLLMKVSDLDVFAAAELLNRMKSIMLKKEVEIIKLEDIERDENFAKKAAERILKNEDMYSLYRKVYLHKEKEIEKNIKKAIKDQSFIIFEDTKIQKKCARVGQSKMFSKNIPYFEKNKNVLRKKWISQAENFFLDRKEVDLHLHMISTIRGAQEVFKGSFSKYKHSDELWIWIGQNEISKIHLKKFLKGFLNNVLSKLDNYSVSIFGTDTKILENIFQISGYSFKKQKLKEKPHVVISYDAGKINSRKSMISPYIPTLIS